MKKKNVVKLMLSTSSLLVFGTIAVSCASNPTIITKKTDIQKTGAVTQINLDANKVEVIYKNKSNLYAKDANSKGVEFSGYDKNEYDVKFLSIDIPTDDPAAIVVGFNITSKSTGEVSDKVAKTISGFKYNYNKDELNKIAYKITLDYNNKANTFPADFNQHDLIISNYDENRFEFVFKEFKYTFGTSLQVVFLLKNKANNVESDTIKIKINGFKPPVISKDALNKAVNGVIISYPNVANIYVDDSVNGNLDVSGYDNTQFKFDVLTSNVNDVTNSLTITFRLVDINYFGNFSDNRSFTIFGFRNRALTSTMINNLAKLVKVDVPNKENLLVNEVSDNDLKFANYNPSRVQIIDREVNVGDDNSSIRVSFKLKDISHDNIISDTVNILVKGFKVPKIPQSILNSEVEKVKITYPNSSEISADEAVDNKFEVSGYDTSKYNFILLSKSYNWTTLTIKFQLTQKHYNENKSTIRTFKITGFKISPLETKKINEELNKITADYPEKATILAKNTVDNSFKFSGFDSKKYKIEKSQKTVSSDGSSVSFTVNLIAIDHPQIISTKRKITILGFQKPPLTFKQAADEIKFTYANKENIYPWDAQSKTVKFENVPKGFTVSNVEVFGILPGSFGATVRFKISNKSGSAILTGVIDGFKKVNLTDSDLSRLILGDFKGLVKYKPNNVDKVFIFKELVKPNGKFIFDITNKKIVVPNGNTTINLSDPSTYVDVGDLTDLFEKKVVVWQNAFEKLLGTELSILGTNAFDTFTKLASISSEQATKLIKENSTLFAILKAIEKKPSLNPLNAKITFGKNLVQTINTMAQKSTRTLAFNFKTGDVVVQLGTNEIDFANPTTYSVLFTLQKTLIEKISSQLTTLLTEANLDPTLISAITNGKITTIYTYQKNQTSAIKSVEFIRN